MDVKTGKTGIQTNFSLQWSSRLTQPRDRGHRDMHRLDNVLIDDCFSRAAEALQNPVMWAVDSPA